MPDPRDEPLRLDVPDAAFRLAPAERARLVPMFDADALERLLAMIRPDMRTEVLRHFRHRVPGERLGHLQRFLDPVLQSVLEEVWAPAWADVSDEELIADAFGLPGRKVAMRRRGLAPDG